MTLPVTCLLLLAGAEGGHEHISFSAALSAAELRPEMRSVEARLRTRRALDDGLGRLASDPTLQLSPGYRVAPEGNPSGLDASVGIQQSLNLEGWGQARQQAAAAEQEVLAHRASAVRRGLRRNAAQAWLRVWTLSHELELRRRMFEDARTLEEQSRRRLELGMGRRTEVAHAHGFVARARLDFLDAEGRLFDAAIALATACGGDGPMFTEGGPPRVAPPSLDAEILDVSIDPEVLAARKEVDAATRREKEASAQDGWQISTGLSLTHEPREQFISAATLGLTLPVSGRNRRAHAARAADRAAAEQARSAAELSMRLLRVRAIHEVEHSRQVHGEYVSSLVPALNEELAALERELELGAVALRQVIDARMRLLDAELAASRAHAQLHAASFDLSLLVAGELEPSS